MATNPLHSPTPSTLARKRVGSLAERVAIAMTIGGLAFAELMTSAWEMPLFAPRKAHRRPRKIKHMS